MKRILSIYTRTRMYLFVKREGTFIQLNGETIRDLVLQLKGLDCICITKDDMINQYVSVFTVINTIHQHSKVCREVYGNLKTTMFSHNGVVFCNLVSLQSSNLSRFNGDISSE